MNRSLTRAVSLLLIVISAKALGQKSSPPTAGVVIPIFALLGSDRGDSVSIDPMLMIDGQGIRAVPDPCTETPELRDFENRYLNTGAAYPVVFGGVRRGMAFATKPDATGWGVRLDSNIRIQGLRMALAVGSVSLAGRGGLRRRPTPTERNHLAHVAKEILTSKGVPVASLRRMRLDQITAMELNHSLRLIASVEIERPDKLGMEYSLFFVADPGSDEKSVLWFQHSQGETDAEAVYLIDHLDDEQNGDRMFVRRVFYENYRYEVYKNQGGRWIKEFGSDVFGCL